VLIHDLDKAVRQKRYLPAVKGAHSGMMAPIQVNGSHSIGIIAVLSGKRYAFDEEDRDLLSQLARCAGDACASVAARESAAEVEKLRLVSYLLNGLEHDLGRPIREVLQASEKDAQGQNDELLDFVLTGMDAYQFVPLASSGSSFLGLEPSVIERVSRKTHEFSLKPIIGRCERVLSVCGRKKPRIRVQCPGDYQIRGDSSLVTMVLYNLLKNARGHSSKETRDKAVIVVSVRRSAGTTAVSITDANKPLPSHIASALASRRFQFSSDAIGLSLINLFVRAHPGPGEGGRGVFTYARRGGRNTFIAKIDG
jgi:K+-sensing histidine kinase KdpD